MRTVTFSFLAIGILLCGQFTYSQTITGRSGIDIMSNGSLFFTPLVNNGSVNSRYDIVFIGDGFKASEQGVFNDAVASAVATLRNTPPYSTNMCAINIWRVNVVSPSSGIDHPRTSVFVNTALDCSYSNGTDENSDRCIYTNSPAKCYAAAGNAPGTDAVIVLVNDLQYGGCAGIGTIICTSITPGFPNIVSHELGHRIVSLADEYSCYLCNSTDNNRSYFGLEPPAVNLTANTSRFNTKWATLINGSTAIPTTDNIPNGVVGLWQGGGYYGSGIFRAQANCMMSGLGNPMCTVCSNESNRIFSRFLEGCTSSTGMHLTSRPHGITHSLLSPVIRFRLFDERYAINWPIPSCKVCKEEVSKIILDGINPASFRVEVMDEENNSIAQNNTKENKSTEISFIPKAGTRYYLQVSARNKGATGKMNNAAISMTVNDVKFPLE